MFKSFSFFRRKPHSEARKWQPVPHSVIRDEQLRATLHEEGISVRPFLNAGQVEALQSLYADKHQFDDPSGGMFYSVYSQDLDYREKVHRNIFNIIQPSLDLYLRDYRAVLNSFIVKAPGPRSEFAVHQDTTGLDEYQYSALNIWIPLEDVNEENGTLCVMRGSHRMFSPYRGISFPTPWSAVVPTVRRYLEPVVAKAGEAIIFDNRILHNSLPNQSGRDRVAIVSGIFPAEAKLMTCYKDPARADAQIELIEHEDDFLLKYPNFLINCHQRPDTGKTIGWVRENYPLMDVVEFEKRCAEFGLKPLDLISIDFEGNCNMIGEPIHEEDSSSAK